jgi:hypothetical protein
MFLQRFSEKINNRYTFGDFMDTRDLYKLVRELSEDSDDVINLYDSMDIELSEGFVIETGVVGFTEDGVIVHLDEDAMEFLDFNGILLESIDEEPAYWSDPVEDFIQELMDTSDPYEMIYGAISGDYGEEVRKEIQYYYDDVVISSGGRFHPDDNFEDIIANVVFQLDKEYGVDYQYADNVKEGGYGSNRDIFHIDDFKRKLSTSNDPFEMIYDAISGDYGEEIRDVMQEMYDDVVIDSQGRLHPDDDFEDIVACVVDMIEKDQGVSEGAYSDHWDSKYDDDSSDPSVTPRDKERAAGRRKAEDDGWDPKRDEIDETDQLDELSLIKKLIGGKPKPKVTATHKTPAELWKQHTEPKKSTSEVPVDPNTGKTLYQKVKDLAEAEYQGRKVQLNKPMAGDVKKSKVYVKKPNGKVVKVNFGDKNMKIKKSNPERRKSFRARHNCDNPGPKWRARYWSCRAW